MSVKIWNPTWHRMTMAMLIQVHLPHFVQLPQDTVLVPCPTDGQRHHRSALWQFLRERGLNGRYETWQPVLFFTEKAVSVSGARHMHNMNFAACTRWQTLGGPAQHLATRLELAQQSTSCSWRFPLYPGGSRCLIHSVLEKEIKKLIHLHSFDGCTRCRSLCLKECPEHRMVFLICSQFLVTAGSVTYQFSQE